MTPAAIVKAAATDGVRLALTDAGTLKTIGHPDAVRHWLPHLRDHKAAIIQLLAVVNDPTTAAATGRLIHFADDRDPVEVWAAPALTHAEVLTAYPASVAVEPVRKRVGARSVTPHERDELLAPIQAIYAADTDRDRQEAIDAALADPASALTCDQTIAAECGIELGEPVRILVRTETAVRDCSTCRHRKRPGLSSPGYCSGARDDLEPAYTPRHPLRKLPADLGASCDRYLPHEGANHA